MAKRLTNDIKTAITASIVKNTIEKKFEGLNLERNKIGDGLHELCMANYREEVKKLPAGFMPSSKVFFIRALVKNCDVTEPMLAEEYDELMDAKGRAVDKAGEDVSIHLSQYSVVPSSSTQGRATFVLGDEFEALSEYRRLSREAMRARNGIHTVKEQTRKALDQFKNVKELVELWPEIVEYIPASILDDEKKFLPALKLDAVNELINNAKPA